MRDHAKNSVPAIAGSVLAVAILLSGCAGNPTDMSSDGQVTHLDDLDPQEATGAKREIFQGLSSGVSRYTLVPGDQLEFLFHPRPDAAGAPYQIAVGDKLGVEFYYQPSVSRSVRVRPDGMITLPIKGDIRAAGLTTAELTADLRDRFSDIFKDPVVSVSVDEYTSAYDDLNSALTNIQGGRAQRVTVTPDGQISLPLIPPIQAGGAAVEDVRQRANELYRETDANISVSASLHSIVGNRIFVFGEVRSPGMLTQPQAQTALQAITTAGGVLPTGSMRNVKVVYWTAEGETRVRTLDLEAILTGKNVAQDMVLPSNTAIYVPPTTITRMNRGIDQYIRQMFLFNGLSANVTWLINENSSIGIP